MSKNIIGLKLCFHPSEKSDLCDRDFTKCNLPTVYYKEDVDFYFYLGIKYFSVTYYMFYKENYAIGLFGLFPKSSFLGYHEYDIEYVRILYNIESMSPEFVFFSSHAQEGIWKNFNDCVFFKDKLVIYVAYGSHANKPINKTYYRMFGFANDNTSNKGRQVIPLLEKDNSLPYYKVLNKEVFSNPCSAFFMPLILYKKEKLINDQKNIEKSLNI